MATWTPSGGVTTLVITSDGSPQKGSLNIVSINSLLVAPAPATYTGSDPNLYVWSIAIRQEATMMTWAAGGMAGIVNEAAAYALTITSLGAPSGTGDLQSPIPCTAPST